MSLTTLNKSDAQIFKEVSMGGRFGKYGDAKRKALLCTNGFERKCMFKDFCTFCTNVL